MAEPGMELENARVAAWGWGFAFVAGMILAPGFVHMTGIRTVWTPFLIYVPMLLLIPYVRATNRLARAKGADSPALTAYNKRMVVASIAYVFTLLGAVTATQKLHPQGPLAWLLALLPALGILAMLAAMARYLVEETDEYLRAKMVFAALIATGLLLALATFWGFLESFRLVPHVPGWAAVPVWGIGLWAGNLVHKARA